MTTKMVIHEDGSWHELDGSLVVTLTDEEINGLHEMSDNERLAFAQDKVDNVPEHDFNAYAAGEAQLFPRDIAHIRYCLNSTIKDEVCNIGGGLTIATSFDDENWLHIVVSAA